MPTPDSIRLQFDPDRKTFTLCPTQWAQHWQLSKGHWNIYLVPEWEIVGMDWSYCSVPDCDSSHMLWIVKNWQPRPQKDSETVDFNFSSHLVTASQPPALVMGWLTRVYNQGYEGKIFVEPDFFPLLLLSYVCVDKGPDVAVFLEPLSLPSRKLIFFVVNDSESRDSSGGSHWYVFTPKNDQFQISPAASLRNIISHSMKNLAFHISLLR